MQTIVYISSTYFDTLNEIPKINFVWDKPKKARF